MRPSINSRSRSTTTAATATKTKIGVYVLSKVQHLSVKIVRIVERLLTIFESHFYLSLFLSKESILNASIFFFVKIRYQKFDIFQPNKKHTLNKSSPLLSNPHPTLIQPEQQLKQHSMATTFITFDMLMVWFSLIRLNQASIRSRVESSRFGWM